MPKKDLTGMRFGRLIVIEEVPPLRSPKGQACRAWKCKCDCGNETIVRQNSLTANKNPTRSCGCLQREKARAMGKDITGQRFGRLTAVRRVEAEKPDGNGARTKWLCRCDCGNKTVLWYKDLLSGVQSCGCLKSDVGRQMIVERNVLGHYNDTTVSAIRPERGPNKNSKSGVKGVHWSEAEKCWIAKIGLRGREITLGRYATLDEAKAAREAAEKAYYEPIIKKYEEEKKNEENYQP